MSLVATEPQPALAWSFESSNVDSVTSLAPVFSSTTAGLTFAPTYQPGEYNLGMRLVNTNLGTGNTWVRYNFTSSIPADSGITLACWVNYTSFLGSTSSAVTLYDNGSPFANTISVGLTSTTSLGYTNGSATYSSILTPNSITGTYVIGKWYHLVVTFTSSSIIQYVNGVASTPKSTGATGLSFSAMRLGSYTNAINNNAGFNPANCTIDDLRIYNTALTSTQVLSVYNQQGVPGRAAVSYPMPTGPASIIGNVISSNVYTATRQPDISIAGQTTYSNVAPTTFTNFGTTIPLTPTTTGLTVSIYFKYTAAPYGAEGLWSCRLTSDTSVSVFARQTGSSDTLFGAYNGASTINIPQVSGYSGNRASWTAGRIDHIVCTFTNTAPVVGRMYVNGVLNASATQTTPLFVAPDGDYTCYVPGVISGAGDANMSVYDFRIVNATLSAADVAIMYRNLSGIPVSIPVPTPMFFSGAPLFSQLTPSAASSAVGAYSLRAVNGVTAKAVAVQARPVVQWPPIAMTSNTTAVTAQVYGNGTYIASSSAYNSSGGGSVVEYKAFDNNPTTYYTNAALSYNSTTGIYAGSNSTTISTVSVLGEWLQIQLPTSMILRRYNIVGRQDNNFWQSRFPTTLWIAGSNDAGATWSNVHYQSGLTPPQEGITITIPQTSNSITYSYYRIVSSILGYSGTQRNVFNIASWNLYGDSSSYAPNAAQDFYADSNGNLLTAPVTGQLLQNWLGDATGYVTTWYDQSGNGNHATQATTANQPIIVNSPTGNGYVPNFVSPTPNKFLSIPSSLNLGGINGSYSKSLWTYVTSNVSQFQNFLSTSTSPGVGPGHSIGWSFPSASSVPYFSASQNTYAVNLTSITFALNTWTQLAVTYNNPTQTFIMYRNGVQVYSNTAFTSSFNAGDGALPTNFRIGVGFGNSCNSQNYDVTIFNSALSASDIKTLYDARYQ